MNIVLLLLLFSGVVGALLAGTTDITVLLQEIIVFCDAASFSLWQSIPLFVFVMALLINLPVPLAAVLKVTAGFLFGPWVGALVNIAATVLSAAMGFLLSRHLFRERFMACYGHRLEPFEPWFHKRAIGLFILLRLLFVVPYYLIHILGGLSPIRFGPFMLSTAIGVIPGSLLYAFTGASLDSLVNLQLPSAYVLGLLALVGAVVWFMKNYFSNRLAVGRSASVEKE